MLRNNPDRKLRVFIVWEPVLATDWGRPGPSITANVADRRATHYWDPQYRLSSTYGGPDNATKLASDTALGFKMKDVIWDAALVYRPGVLWGNRAQRLVAPVYRYADSLARSQ